LKNRGGKEEHLMNIQEALREQMPRLSPEDQQKVLQFVQSLLPPAPRRDPKGMYAHHGVRITAEEISEARREAWDGFPRDLPEGAAP
jgi:hypothetical protein